MKKLKLLLISAIGATLLMGFTGCGMYPYTTSYIYDDGDKYTAGDREISEKIENIEIDYMSGNITFVEGDTDKISIKETSSKQLDDARKVHTWVDGNTLYVRYCESAKRLDLNRLDKKLTITVPKDSKYTEFSTTLSSGSIEGSGIDAGTVYIEASSGSISVECEGDSITLQASSGSINLDQHGESTDIKATTSSGSISLDVETVQDLNVQASSGSIAVYGNDIKNFDSETSSGSGTFSFSKVPADSKMTASSGNVKVYVPSDSSISADVDRSSGDFDYQLSFTKEDGRYICGSGENKMDITTSSGNIEINKIAE